MKSGFSDTFLKLLIIPCGNGKRKPELVITQTQTILQQVQQETKMKAYFRGSMVLSPTYATAAKCITASNAFCEKIMLTWDFGEGNMLQHPSSAIFINNLKSALYIIYIKL
jgi:hypothetical protein